jgi:internalin A
MMNRSLLLFSLAVLLLSACGELGQPPDAEKSEAPAAPAAPVAEVEPAPQFWSEVKLHEVIRSANPAYTGNGQFQIDERGQVQAIALDNCGVTDLAPFRGISLMALYLQGCAVPDISVLKGMPLVELYLEKSAVKDLSPLAGMSSLQKLYLSGTAVTDLKP